MSSSLAVISPISSACRSGGTVRISTSMVQRSGITLVCTPPSILLTDRLLDPSTGSWVCHSRAWRWSSAITSIMPSTAFRPSCGMEPWALRPNSETRSHSAPLWPTATRLPVGSAMTRPSSSARLCCSAYCRAPQLSTSSPAVARKIRSPPSRMPSWCSDTAASSMAASPLFISEVPRPYILPFSITAPCGG
ncbi:hypothetical protein D3C75_938460 [compost metagenome]